jgi:hypothetical protein
VWLLQRSIRHAAILDAIDVVEVFNHAVVVSNTDNGTAFFSGDLAKQCHHTFTALGIEGGRGFISEDYLRRVCQGAGNGDALLFAARKFLRQVVLAFSDAEVIK